MKLVPGARVKIHGIDPRRSFLGRSCLKHSERIFVSEVSEALVVGVYIGDDRNDLLTTTCDLWSVEEGFFNIESSRFRVIWSPED